MAYRWYGEEYPFAAEEIPEIIRTAIARGKAEASMMELVRSTDPTNHAQSSVPSGVVWAAQTVGQLIIEVLQKDAQRALIDNLLANITNISRTHKFAGIPTPVTYAGQYIQRYPTSICYDAKKLSLPDLANLLLKSTGEIYEFITEAGWIGSLNGWAGFGAITEKFYNPEPMLRAYNDLQWQASIMPRMRRHWLREYTPTIPDTRLAWTLYTRGNITLPKFEEYASYEGWDEENAKLLEKALYKLPTDRTAFNMYLRGQLSLKDVHEKYYANAWQPEWHSKLDAIFWTLPSVRQAFSLMKRGSIKYDQYKRYVLANGWEEWWHSHLYELFQRLPTARDAFNMFMREAITEDQFDEYVKKDEWEDGSAARLWAIYQRLPYGRDAFRLMRRGRIDVPTMTKLFKAQGYMETYQKMLPTIYERILSAHDAHTLKMRGAIDQNKYNEYLYKNEWEPSSANLLDSLWERLPSYREAFYMCQKGLITTAERDALFLAADFAPKWHSKLVENSYYIPTVYDLTRIADCVEIDLIWATKILKERGLRDRDIPKIVEMLKIRPLRDEIRRQIAIWVKRYKLGWITPTQLETALTYYHENGWIKSTEKTMLTEEAEISYEDELMAEQIDIFSWYFKTGVISDEDLLADFLALGIREEKANLMVEGLKAQGYYGYY